MFYFSNALKEAPNFGDKTKNCDDMNGMFYKCTSLTSIPQLDTSNVIDMGSMFYNCSALTSIPQLDTSKVTNMSNMFYNCSALTTIPQLDTGNVTNMCNMFSYCSSLTSIPQLDTSKVTNMQGMFNNCSSLTTIPLLDTSKLSDMRWFFYGGNSLTDLDGFKDLGKQSSVTGINDHFLNYAPNLTHESLMNVIYNLYDRKANRLSTLSVKFGTTNLNKLTDEEKAIAINKGWNLI
jgi:surface protein